MREFGFKIQVEVGGREGIVFLRHILSGVERGLLIDSVAIPVWEGNGEVCW